MKDSAGTDNEKPSRPRRAKARRKTYYDFCGGDDAASAAGLSDGDVDRTRSRKIRNRHSAARSRERARMRVSSLEETVASLESSRKQLRTRLVHLKREQEALVFALATILDRKGEAGVKELPCSQDNVADADPTLSKTLLLPSDL